MLQFFRGWKRKVGCATLLVACLFTAGWVRSFYEITMVSLNKMCADYAILSGVGDLRVFRGRLHQYIVEPIPDRGPKMTVLIDHQKPKVEKFWPTASLRYKTINRYDLAAFDTSTEKPEPIEPVPYWSIVIPLTVISAWLLLSRPRTKTEPPTPRASENA